MPLNSDNLLFGLTYPLEKNSSRNSCWVTSTSVHTKGIQDGADGHQEGGTARVAADWLFERWT